jgi:tetrahydromethanopterin S-methyltransferase subunit F
MKKLKAFFQSPRVEGFASGFMMGVFFLMFIRALRYWIYGDVFPLGY